MNKSDMFPIHNSQERKLNQVKSLADLLSIASGLNSQHADDLSNCLGLVSDLANQTISNQAKISHAYIQLNVVNNAVNGE